MAPPSRGAALVTGASSGIGAAFADALAERGHDLVLVARRGEPLGKRATVLKDAHGVAVEVFPADLATAAGMRAVEARLDLGGIGMLVNNAGVGDIAAFLDADREAHARMIAVNITALTRLSHAACSAMLRQGGGTMINVASGFAFDLMPGAAVYAASKAYVFQLTQVLAAELSGQGIAFQCLVPGLTRTNLGGAEESGLFDLFPPEMIQSPRAVAEASLAGLALGELVCIPKLEDYAAFEQAHAAMRAIGREPGHNRVAARYGVDLT